MRITITEEAPNFTSPCYCDGAYQGSGPGQEVLLGGGAYCLQGAWLDWWIKTQTVGAGYTDNRGTVGEMGITCQLGKVNVRNDGCQPVRTREVGGSVG